MDNMVMKVTPLKTAGVFLLLALISLVAGYVRGHQVRADAVAFANEGVETVGRVLNKTSEWDRNHTRYTVYFEYKGPDGVMYRESEVLPSSSFYDEYRVGGPITLTYLRSRPDHFYLPAYKPSEKYAHIFDIFFYLGLAGTLASLACIAFLLLAGSGRSARMVQQTSGSGPAGSVPPPPRAASRPQGFGRR
jgi:hypothetical protein